MMQAWSPVHLSQFHYLPLTLPFFSLLVGALIGILAVLIASLSGGADPGPGLTGPAGVNC